MDDPAESQMKSHDEPLFVLKYQENKVTVRVLCWAFFVLFLCVLPAFAVAVQEGFGFSFLIAAIWLSFMVGLAAFMMIDIALFKEVRLYSDRIVKIWKYFGPVEVQFENAKFGVDRDFNQNVVTVLDRNANRLLLSIKGVQYDDSLADKEDVRKLNSFLAELTGRRVEEFEKTAITLDPLIKKEKC